jgi:hypothetical protein
MASSADGVERQASMASIVDGVKRHAIDAVCHGSVPKGP